MEMKFETNRITCLDTALREIRNLEQTQEIRIPDGMPDIGSVLSAWGQVILRGKEWHSDAVAFSGGMMVWVLYQAEDGSGARCIDSWIPFQMKWDLPEETPEGRLRIQCLPRFVDARNVSPRKLMVRAGVSALAEAFSPMEAQVSQPIGEAGNVELLRSTYPVRLMKEAGEKTFLMDEDIALPDSAPEPEKIVYFRMNPRITEKRVLSDKLVFRGSGNLHTLYQSEEGKLQSWDFELPFSQYAQLETEHSPDAQADVQLMPTNLEMEVDDEGHLRFKGGMVAQYLITDKQLLQLVEDAYSPEREIGIQTEMLELPVVLENRWENLYGEQKIQAQADSVADVNFLPEFPRQRRTDTSVDLEIPGTFQVLYYGEDGILRSGTARWAGQQHMAADESSRITALPMTSQPQAIAGNGQILVKTELPVEMTTESRQQLPMVSGVELGQTRVPDPNRPTLILRRAGEDRLWDIAKSSGSTMEIIRRANGLQEEPAPDRMLLIPVR